MKRGNTMKKIANKNASEYVNKCDVFQGSNIFAEVIRHHTLGCNEDLYVVYSYGHHFPMYVYDYDTREWYANSNKYSSTTSRHQSQCRPRFEITYNFNTEDLIKLIEQGGMVGYVKWKAVA
tara:strand:+ start:1748 stop:2110 length:363 start_codon:yes stop_codon:yes gene_type:complete